MTEAMPFLRKLITFLWPPDIRGRAFCCPPCTNAQKRVYYIMYINWQEGLR